MYKDDSCFVVDIVKVVSRPLAKRIEYVSELQLLWL